MTIERNILPASWATATIGQLIGAEGIFIDGDWVESKDQDPDGSVRLIQLADIGDGDFRDKSRRFLTLERAYELHCTFLEHGDILVARMPEPLGRCCIFPLDCKDGFVTVVDVCVVRVGSAPIDNRFLMNAINSGQVRTKIADLQSGSTRKRISRGNLATIEIPIAPYKEQQRIVAKLEELFSELDKGVESLTTAREQLKAYRQAILKHAFEGKLTEDWRAKNSDKPEVPEEIWNAVHAAREAHYAEALQEWQKTISQWRTASEIDKKPQKPSPPAQIEAVSEADTAGLPALPSLWRYVRLDTIAQIGSGMSVSKDREVAEAIDVPYLRVANVQRGRLDLTHVVSMKIEKGQLPALALKMWDVLFNEGGDRDKLGRGWIWQQQIAPCITQNHVFRASPYLPSETSAKCISYWGNTYGQKYFDTEGKQTTNLASINKGVLSSFPVPLVPPKEQVELVRRLEATLSLSELS